MTSGIDKFVLKVVNDLAAELAGIRTRMTVMEVVLRASIDLEGQIALEAAGEMLYRLARHRLLTMTVVDQRGASGSSSSSGSSSRRR